MIDIRNNTVDAGNQMVNASSVLSYMGDPNASLKILVVGNSITRHGPKSEIGWDHDWGMAASAPEKDYVHLLFGKLCAAGVKPYMMVRQAASWEVGILNDDILDKFADERTFDADIVVYRLGENVKKETKHAFGEKLEAFINHICPRGKVIFTTCFWHNNIVDDCILALAEKRGEVCVNIECTAEDQMALGLFEHKGVAMHPGDKGMEMIADRVAQALLAEVGK